MFYLLVIIALLALIGAFVICNLIFSSIAERKLLRDNKKGFANLLRYATIIEDGIILCKDGSLTVSYEYTCPDSDSSTDDEKDALVARLNQAIRGLGKGWMLQVDSIRSQVENYSNASDSHFNDDITQAIDNERRTYFTNLRSMYESRFIITITYLPPKLISTKFEKLMYQTDESENKKDLAQEILNSFKKQLSSLENMLSISLNIKRLNAYERNFDNDELHQCDKQLEFINACIYGDIRPVRLPNDPMFMDSLLATQDFHTGTVPKLGEKLIACVAIDGFPAESYSGILNILGKLSCSCRWNTRFIFLDNYDALHQIKKYRDKWNQKIRGLISAIFDLKSNLNLDAIDMTEDADAFTQEVSSELVGAGYYSSTIILMNENYDNLMRNVNFVVKMISHLGFSARHEKVNAIESYLGSLPADGTHNIRKPLIHTLNLAHLLPTSSIWTGSSICPCPFYPQNSPALMYTVTDGSTPFRLNLHVRDLGHTLIIGPTGAGKSTLLAMIAAQLRRYKGMSIFAFDKGMSMYALCKAVGGTHYEIAGEDSSLQFCPLQYNNTSAERENSTQWLIAILELNNINGTGKITPDQIIDIKNALEAMNLNRTKTLSNFYSAVQNIEIKSIIQNYCGSSLMGLTLDGTQDSLTFSEMTVFEMEEIMNQPDKNRIPILLYLFNRIQDALKGQPAVIILDEAWIMLSNEVFREKIREWLKVLRKANCAVVMATQSISDATNSGIMDVINESTASKIFLPNSSARNEETAQMYKSLGLNDRQIEIIADSIPKKEYYYVSSEGRRLFSLDLQPLSLAFVACSDKDSIARIKKLENEFGSNWPTQWLHEKGVL